MDRAGNVYVGGGFEGTASFDGGDLTAEMGARNLVVVAYAGDGTHRWDHQIATVDAEYFMRLAPDPTGSSIFVSGSFLDSLDLGDGTPITRPDRNVYLAELDAGTGRVEHRAVFSVGNDIRVAGLVVTASSVLLAGWTDAEEIGGAPIDGGFLVQFDRTLATMSTVPLPRVTSVWGVAAHPAGGYVLAGSATGVFDLGCASPRGEAGLESLFVAAWDASGGCRWIYDRPISVRQKDLAVHSDGSVYVTGSYESTVDFGGGDRTAPPGLNGFVLALDPAGTYAWDSVFSSPSYVSLEAIEARSDGVIAVGAFRDSLRIGGSTIAGSSDLTSVIVQLSFSGAVRPTQTFVGDSNNEAYDIVVGVGGSTVVVGHWDGRLTIGGATFASTPGSSGIPWPDAYVVRPSSM